MKLLLDQNISRKLVLRLADLFPGSAHIWDLKLDLADDEVVWREAVVGGFVVVSKDDDFRERAIRLPPPPKVIWMKVGNATTDRIEELLRSRVDEIRAFGAHPTTGLLILP